MLIFSEKLPSSNQNAIIDKINSVAANLGIDPNWLMAVMSFESNLNPKAKNPYSGATGLIQFMPATAKGLGTTVEQLFYMPFEQQLTYVEKYYQPYKSKIKGFVDLYLATFYPLAIGKPDSYVIGSHKGPSTVAVIAKQNQIFDPLNTGKVTVAAIKRAILTKIPANYVSSLVQTPTGLGLAFVGLGIFTFLLFKTL